ncbi:hypothetical protein D3C84_785940 [compost metagenome]
MRAERAQRIVCDQNLRPSAHAVRFERREHIVAACISMHFRRPIVLVRPEPRLRTEGRIRTFPLLQIPAPVYIETDSLGFPYIRVRRTVQIIAPFVFLPQNERVAHLNVFLGQHRRSTSFTIYVRRDYNR